MSRAGEREGAAARRRRIGLAALRVLARDGPRGCTHRAVDTAAGLPPGSVNYHAPTRRRLLELALDELFAQDMAVVETHFPLSRRWSAATIETAMAGFVRTMSADDARHRVVARHHLLGESRTDEALRARFAQQRVAFTRLVQSRFTGENRAESTACAEAVMIVLDGLLHRQVFFDDSALAEADVVRIVRVVLGGLPAPAADS